FVTQSAVLKKPSISGCTIRLDPSIWKLVETRNFRTDVQPQGRGVLDRVEPTGTLGADPGARNLTRSITVAQDSESSPAGNCLYCFGQFVLDPRKRTLSRADAPVFLTPKAFDVLAFLVRNPNRLVTKEEMLGAVWGDIFV